MTTDLQFPALESVRPSSAGAWADGQPISAGPKHRRPVATSWTPPQWSRTPRADVVGQLLIALACVLLAGLAVAMGITSFHAQFTYIFATKRQWAPSLLEALGLDAGAVIFSLLGIALARLGRRAAVERVLVVICALGSCGMNVLNANLGSPRSVAVYAMPPVLFALTSDRLVAVVRRAALGTSADDEPQRSAWYIAGRSLLYGMRFAVDRRGTAAGLRQAILDSTPLPQPATPLPVAGGRARARVTTRDPGDAAQVADASDRAANPARPRPVPTTAAHDEYGNGERPRSQSRKDTKTARFLTLVQQTHGPLSGLDLGSVYRVSAELAPRVRLNTGSARAALRAAVLAAWDGAR